MNYRRITLVWLVYGVWWSLLACLEWWVSGSSSLHRFWIIPGVINLAALLLVEGWLIPQLPSDPFWRLNQRSRLMFVPFILICGGALTMVFFDSRPAKPLISPTYLTPRSFLICGVIGFGFGVFLGNERVRKYHLDLRKAIREAGSVEE